MIAKIQNNIWHKPGIYIVALQNNILNYPHSSKLSSYHEAYIL